jgi:hypothetical protein
LRAQLSSLKHQKGGIGGDGLRRRGGDAPAAQAGGGPRDLVGDEDDDDEAGARGFALWQLIVACFVFFLFGRLSLGGLFGK